VYLPGYGLCDINRSNKKRKATTAADAASTTPNLTPTVAAVWTPLRHRSIGLRPHNDTHDHEVNSVLNFTMVVRHLGAIVGRDLETLRLASDQATEDTLREILAHYKKLHCLCLLDAKLDDLSGLVVGYHEGSQISSDSERRVQGVIALAHYRRKGQVHALSASLWQELEGNSY
jgi:hypothetical protein